MNGVATYNGMTEKDLDSFFSQMVYQKPQEKMLFLDTLNFHYINALQEGDEAKMKKYAFLIGERARQNRFEALQSARKKLTREMYLVYSLLNKRWGASYRSFEWQVFTDNQEWTYTYTMLRMTDSGFELATYEDYGMGYTETLEKQNLTTAQALAL